MSLKPEMQDLQTLTTGVQLEIRATHLNLSVTLGRNVCFYPDS